MKIAETAAPHDGGAVGFVAAVQRNCDLADARHAQQAPLCTYLLQLREHFRWRHGLPLDAAPDRREVGRFIAAHESHWDTLEAQATAQNDPQFDGFASLPPGHDPFDVAAVNAALEATGFHYGAGIGRAGRPDFFVARLLRDERRGSVRVVLTGEEQARGVSPPIAFSRDGVIVVRTDAMRRWLWTRLELVERNGDPSPLARALASCEGDSRLARLDRLVEREAETLILHETGEDALGPALGGDWHSMLASLDDARAELCARAVRDLAADCGTTLPALLASGAEGSVHFWFSTFEGVRRALDPALAAAYPAWAAGDSRPLMVAIDSGADRWRAEAAAMLRAWRGGGPSAARRHAAATLAAAGV